MNRKDQTRLNQLYVETVNNLPVESIEDKLHFIYKLLGDMHQRLVTKSHTEQKEVEAAPIAQAIFEVLGVLSKVLNKHNI